MGARMLVFVECVIVPVMCVPCVGIAQGGFNMHTSSLIDRQKEQGHAE